MFVMVDCVREMTEKKSCKYGEYGSSEHLLFFIYDGLVILMYKGLLEKRCKVAV